MSEQRQERWSFGDIETDTICQRGIVVHRPCNDGRAEFTPNMLARIIKDHNACLSMSDPEADVRAMVGALQMCHDYLAERNLGVPARSVQSIANAALARLGKHA